MRPLKPPASIASLLLRTHMNILRFSFELLSLTAVLTSIISIIPVHVAVKHTDTWGVYDDYECFMHQPTRAQQSKGGRSMRGKQTKMESFITAAAQSPLS